jgi:hypothetical protein
MRPVRFAAIIIALFSIGACQKSSNDVSGTLANLRLDDLERKVSQLERRADEDRRANNVAQLTPTDKGYSFLPTNAGPITVEVIEVAPYANGTRVKLRLGNLTNASISKMTAHLRWGASKDGETFSGQPREELRHSFNEILPPGSFHTEVLDLAGVPSSQLGLIEFSYPSVESIRLNLEQ